MAAEDAVEEQPEEEQEKGKKDDYLKFRRSFDSIKRKHDGECAESDKIKQQGNNFFSLGLYMQASMMYTEAIELQPQNHVLYCNRSMAYLKQDMPVEALEDALESLKLESSAENIKAYWRKAQALVDLNRHDEAEAAADDGLALQPGNKHLNSVRRVSRETVTLRKLCRYEWVSKMPNGIEKRYKFSDNGVLKMTVFGHSLESTFDLSVEGNPRSIVVRMKPDGQQGPPPPPMPYIFEFHDDGEELWLCHPVNTTDLPTTFEGPGFDKMRRGPPIEGEAAIEATDEVCEKYLREMNEALPLVPPQLPELPSDEEISREALIMDKIAKLKQKYGLAVHQRATELAKDPASTSNEALSSLALELRKRFINRKILAEPSVIEEAAVKELTKAVAAAPAPAPAQPQALGCLGSIVARLCGGQS